MNRYQENNVICHHRRVICHYQTFLSLSLWMSSEIDILSPPEFLTVTEVTCVIQSVRNHEQRSPEKRVTLIVTIPITPTNPTSGSPLRVVITITTTSATLTTRGQHHRHHFCHSYHQWSSPPPPPPPPSWSPPTSPTQWHSSSYGPTSLPISSA